MQYIRHSVTASSVNAQIGAMIISAQITAVHNWTVRANDLGERALAKVKDPEILANYWPMIVFMREKLLGDVFSETRMAMAFAILAAIKDIYNDQQTTP